MTKRIELSPYTPKWLEIFDQESILLRKTLSSNLIDIHHIGSTAVPGLCAKPIIDILIVVKDNQIVAPALQLLGYKAKGELNIPFREYFSKQGEEIKFHLHAYEEGNPEIEFNLLFRDSLRKSPETLQAYADLKSQLVKLDASHQKDSNHFTGYTFGKYEFIQEILDKAGFDRFRLMFCAHPKEWETHHRIRKEQIFDLINVDYDPNHPTITDPNHFHFALYKGTKIVGCAHVEFLENDETALRPFAIDAPYQNQGWGSIFLPMIETWLKRQGKTILRLHANTAALSFYERLGYEFMDFNEPPISVRTVDMGKKL